MFNSGDSTTMYALILLRRWVSVLWVFFSVLKVRPESFVTFQKDFCFLLLPPKVWRSNVWSALKPFFKLNLAFYLPMGRTWVSTLARKIYKTLPQLSYFVCQDLIFEYLLCWKLSPGVENIFRHSIICHLPHVGNCWKLSSKETLTHSRDLRPLNSCALSRFSNKYNQWKYFL